MFANREIYAVTLEGLTEKIHFDPMAIRRTLLIQSSGRCWQWVQDANAIVKQLDEILPEDESEQAKALRAELSMRLSIIEGDLADAGYHAFNFEPVDLTTGQGVTETQMLKILAEYIGWVELKKVNAGNSLTS